MIGGVLVFPHCVPARDLRIEAFSCVQKFAKLWVAAFPFRPVDLRELNRAIVGLRRVIVAMGTTVNDEFREQHAKTVRALAEKADPFTKKRLLELANRYDRHPRLPTLIPSISAERAS